MVASPEKGDAKHESNARPARRRKAREKHWFAELWPKLTPLASAIATVIMTSVGWYILYVWHTPDLRYETGAYYRSGDIAVASLKLQNCGTVDAEDISINVNFPETIERDASTSDDATPLVAISGGKGSKVSVGKIGRLVPEQSVIVYYAIHNPEGPIPTSAGDFVNQIVYKGGKGQTGRPLGWLFWSIAAAEVFCLFRSLLWYSPSKNAWKDASGNSSPNARQGQQR